VSHQGPRTNEEALDVTTTAAPARSARRRTLPWPLAFYATAVGKKWVMAVSGIGLLGFVLVHMIGNLKLYLGEEDINKYGVALREIGGDLLPHTSALWALRIGLILCFVLHIHAAYTLTLMNRRARPVGYAGGRNYIAANYAARTMRWSGVIVGLFLLFHLADLTWGWVNPDFIHGEPYHNMVESMSRWPVALLYIVANLALGLHIYHGAWSMFQSLGVNSPRINLARRYFAAGFAALIVIGNLSFPIAILTGAV
jgi:succinate dehydrogenase / fumarate reductase, cytochrome b subunit